MELKEIPGFDGRYGVTIDGQVWDYISEKFLKLKLDSKRYCVGLYKINGTRKYYFVHRLVMATWGDLDLDDTQMVAHHIDGNKSNNCIDNLHIMSDYEHRCKHNPMRAKGYGIDTKTHKLCTKCEILKLRSDFSVNSCKPDGLSNCCISCHSLWGKNYYQQNKEQILQRKRRR